MAIRKRLKERDPETQAALDRHSQWRRENFNFDDSLFKYHQRFWDEHYPAILERMKLDRPDVAVRLADISWDRKYAAVVWYLMGCPEDQRPWPDPKIDKWYSDGKVEKTPAAPKKKLLLSKKRTPGKS